MQISTDSKESKSLYDYRAIGKVYCNFEGSEHYRNTTLEPMDLIIDKGLSEDFCLGNIIKYAARFKRTQKLSDLQKIADYAHILCGVKMNEEQLPPQMES